MAKFILTDLFEGEFPVSQKFGNNPTFAQLGMTPPAGVSPNAYFYGYYGLKGHEGIDFATPSGTWLNVPFEKGQVLRVAYSPGYGNHAVIWDSVQRCAVWYCHMSSFSCSPGQILSRGTRVGKTGNTGSSTAPHLHVNFVETDGMANRINTGNGYGGNLNILDRNLVSWGTPAPVLTPEQKIQKIKDLFTQALSGDQFRDKTKQILGL